MCAAPTRDANGAADGAVTVLTDVTDGRRLEQERERALNDLRDADRRKDEFLAMLSHELRNPLAPILNAGEVLARLQTGARIPPPSTPRSSRGRRGTCSASSTISWMFRVSAGARSSSRRSASS